MKILDFIKKYWLILLFIFCIIFILIFAFKINDKFFKKKQDINIELQKETDKILTNNKIIITDNKQIIKDNNNIIDNLKDTDNITKLKKQITLLKNQNKELLNQLDKTTKQLEDTDSQLKKVQTESNKKTYVKAFRLFFIGGLEYNNIINNAINKEFDYTNISASAGLGCMIKNRVGIAGRFYIPNIAIGLDIIILF